MSKLDQIRALADAKRSSKNERPKASNRIIAGLEEAIAVSRGDAAPAKVTIYKRGRPLAKDALKSLTKTKPWLVAGMSRASWYRRQKAVKK